MEGAYFFGGNMNKQLILLAILTFLAGLTELVLSGILPYIAKDFNVSIPVAGNLITIFAVCFAIAGPIIMAYTAHMQKKKLLIGFIILFIIGNLASAFSTQFWMLMASRMLLAVCVSMLIWFGLSLSVRVVEESYQTKAISVIMMSISGSLVLGIPLGILITEYFGWQMIFIGTSVLSALILVLIIMLMPEISGIKTASFFKQWGVLKDKRIFYTHMTSFLFFVGQSTFYMYLTPYLNHAGYQAGTVSLLYLTFGVSGILGSALGSTFVERLGIQKTMISLLTIYVFVMLSFIATHHILILLVISMIGFGMLGWALNAPTQTRLILINKNSAGFNQTFSTSSTQFGMALGSMIGGLIIASGISIQMLTVVGAVIVFLALIAIIYSYKNSEI